MRKTDTFRSRFKRIEDRLYRDGGQWYYHTRGVPRGPFETRSSALDDLNRFVGTMDFIDEHPDAVPNDINPDDITHIDLKPPKY